ncbi:hypothetical protein DJ68_14575 [Halorubrum sp. C3]|nr:hypothetical protein DJ68_14575 [Halorubrum sp. C3]
MSTETGDAADAERRSLHADFLHRLVAGAAGSTTEELQDLYETLAPLVYAGTTDMSVSPRHRRRKLNELKDAGLVESFDAPRGLVWVPVEMPEGVENQYDRLREYNENRKKGDGGGDV